MSNIHDSKATLCGDEILKRIREGNTEFKQVFSSSIIRTGDWDWPRPDYVCYDESISSTYALEFKPPYQTKREYLTGLGQSLAYLQKHTYSGLILPYYADDDFMIADFVLSTLESPEFADVTTSLFAYSPKNYCVEILKKIEKPRAMSISTKKYEEVKTFWCWWRETSQYELYDLLNMSFFYGDYSGDIYAKYIYPKFYQMMINGETKQWNGMPRIMNDSPATRNAVKQNTRIPLMQLDLWTRSEGRLTTLGFELLQIGKLYGANSVRFMDKLAYIILVNGRHLDLIQMVNNFNEMGNIPHEAEEYRIRLEKHLDDNGCIGKRKPTAMKTGKKISYIRDEPKLWNKFNLLKMRNSNSYFHPGEGYKFNWDRIHSILLSEK